MNIKRVPHFYLQIFFEMSLALTNTWKLKLPMRAVQTSSFHIGPMSVIFHLFFSKT
jgi:hypothetical protein